MAAFQDYNGQLVTLKTTDEQVFKGTVCSLDENTGKIVLKNASTDGSKLPGLQNFFVSNIKELSLTQEYQALRASEDLRRDGRKKHITPLCTRTRDRQSHLKNLLRFDSDQLVRPHCLGADNGDQGIGSGEDNETVDDFYVEENYILFCQSCDKFRESIVYLMDQKVIAITFLGTDLGRKGTLSLIQIATKEDIFLYDVLRLGVEGFKDGLQALLESNDVLKIIHDCRMVSDLLYHQYQVSLVKVFDTQVASAFVFRSGNSGNWPRFVESLPGVLMTHLGLRSEEVHHFFVRERLKQRDENVWLQRPLCTQLVQDSVRNLVHMIPLYWTLQAKMVTEFHMGVQLYLDQVRNAPTSKVDQFRTSGHLLPFVFQDIPELSQRIPRGVTHYPAKFKGSHGFVDVCPRSGPNMVTTSRDSIWHRKSHFCKATCNCKCGSKKTTKSMGDGDRRPQQPLTGNTFGSSKREFVREKKLSPSSSRRTECTTMKNSEQKRPFSSQRTECTTKKNSEQKRPSSSQCTECTTKKNSEQKRPSSSHCPEFCESDSGLKLSTESIPDNNNNHRDEIRNTSECEKIHNSPEYSPSNSTCLKSKLLDLPSPPRSTGKMSPLSCLKSKLNTLKSSPLSSSSSSSTISSNQSELTKESSSSPPPPSSPPSSSISSRLMAKLYIKADSNLSSPLPKTADQILTHDKIAGRYPLALEKSALFRLGSVQHSSSSSPVPSVKSQSESSVISNNVSNDTPQGMTHQDTDENDIYQSDIVQKILRQARQGHGHTNKAGVKG